MRFRLALDPCRLALGCSVVLAMQLAASGASSQEHSASIEYVVRIADPAVPVVEMEAHLEGLSSEQRELELATIEKYAFTGLPAPRLVGGLRARSGDGEVAVERNGPWRWRVENGGRPTLDLRWSVRLDHREQPQVGIRDAYEFPYLAADHGMLVTAALFVTVARSLDASPSVRFELPEGWEVLAPWSEDADGLFHPRSERELVSNLVAIGNWSQTSVIDHGAEVVIAFSPGRQELERLVVPLMKPVLALELEMFEHEPFERYLVLFGDSPTEGLAGSPKSGAMTLTAKVQGLGPGELEPLVHLVAHEFFHTWSASCFDSPDELRFLNEGFTDFFAILVPVLTGYSRWQDFADGLARAMHDWCTTSDVVGLSLVGAGGGPFFSDTNAERLVYAGGATLAALWDAEIRRARPGSSLIDFMRALHNDERWRPQVAAPRLTDVEAALARFVGAERATELVDLARTPAVPDLAALFTAAGAKVEAGVAPASLELRVNFDGNRVVALDTVDLLARLGIRNGDELLWINGRDVRTPAEIVAAWQAPVEGRIRVRYLRDGKERALDTELPEEVVFTVDPRTWYPIPTDVRFREDR
jgi:predicted metalloprotease with PDZ domain